MKIIEKHLTNGQYLTKAYEKDTIFLHHTENLSANATWRWWNQTPDRVGTAYVIDRDGSVYEFFDPRMYAYSLGITGDDNYHEKHGVGVELVSAGKLHKVDGDFRFYPLWPNQTRYTAIPKDEVISFPKEFKGNKYYQCYTEAQLESLVLLCNKLLKDFPKIKFGNKIDDMFIFDQSIIDEHKVGIYTHGSVRKDKSDIIPYPAVLKALKEIKDSNKPKKKPESDKD